MMQLIRSLLQKCIDQIDAGNSNITSEESAEVIEILRRFTDKDKKLSKYQACRFLNISRATFDRYIKEGKLPQGKKEAGFKEIFWDESILREYLHKYKQSN